MLALGTEISELKATTGPPVGSLQEVKASAVETKSGLKKGLENCCDVVFSSDDVSG